jgi:hypothetical protein
MANGICLAALCATVLGAPASVHGHVEIGTHVENVDLEALEGGRHALLAKGRVNVLVFFRPGQERSLDTMQRLAECEPGFTGKPIHTVAVVSATSPRDEVRALVASTGVKSPILLDDADQVYGRLELRQHPAIVIVDQKWKVHAVEPYQRLRYCDIVRARVRFLLGELDQASVERIVQPERAAFPNQVGGGSAARYVKLGDKELAKGNCALAVRAYDNALRRDPQNARALEGRMRCGVTGPVPPPMKRAEPPEPAGDPAPQPEQAR